MKTNKAVRKLKKTKNIFNAIYPVYVLNKMMGFLCFSIDGDISEGKITHYFWDRIFILWNLIVSAWILYFNATENLSLVHTNSFVIDKGSRLMPLISAISVVVARYINMVLSGRMWSMVSSLHSFDKEVGLKLNRDGILNFFKFVFSDPEIEL